MVRKSKSGPTWTDVKVKLADLDRSALLGLVKDLYAASKDNQNFLHARFGAGDDVLVPYKAIIERCLWPDVYKNQNYSVSTAKKAIADYRKAAGQPEGVAELSVFYCEQAIGFCNSAGLDDDGFYDALVGLAERALGIVMALPEGQREPFLDRLEDVRESSRGIGWGVEEAFNELFRRAGLETDG